MGLPSGSSFYMTAVNNANVYLPGTIQIASSLLITAITNDIIAVITVEVDDVTAYNSYIPGQMILLTIPFEYGMQQANGKTVKILSVDELNFYVDMNSINFDPFVMPGSPSQPASLAPSGSNNLAFSNETNKIAFQSLNNEGN
ncbi:MAG TPA: hypothetical protein VFU05_00820 [Cyclobacteriaceae bacterium]|nr:hypothetical protein [Cyclobacteriaceae bacterium]